MEAAVRKLLFGLDLGVVSKVNETHTAAVMTANSESAMFLKDMKQRQAKMSCGSYLKMRVYTRKQETKIRSAHSTCNPSDLFRERLETAGNQNFVYMSVEAHGDDLRKDREARAELRDVVKEWKQMAFARYFEETDECSGALVVRLSTLNLAVCNDKKMITEPGATFYMKPMGKLTPVGGCPLMVLPGNLEENRPQFTITLYILSGKFKLQAQNSVGSVDYQRAIELIVKDLEAHAGEPLVYYDFSECVNFNRKETEKSPCVGQNLGYVINQLQACPDLYSLHVPPESGRVEVTCKLPATARYDGGNINIYVTSTTIKNCNVNTNGDSTKTATDKLTTSVRLNLTGRYEYDDASDQLDCVSVALALTENYVRHPQFATTVRRFLIERRCSGSAKTLNAQREVERVRQRLLQIRLQIKNNFCYMRPQQSGVQYETPQTPARICSMCMCVKEEPNTVTNQRSNGDLRKRTRSNVLSCAHCTGNSSSRNVTEGCNTVSVATPFRPPPQNNVLYNQQDALIACVLAEVCAPNIFGGISTPTCHEKNKVCTGCFQQNNRRQRTIADKWRSGDGFQDIHQNSLYILRFLAIGHPNMKRLKRRNQIKAIKRFVRIITTTVCFDDSGRYKFVCPLIFRAILENMVHQWRASNDAIVCNTNVNQGTDKRIQYGPLGNKHQFWTKEAVCAFRAWCSRCPEINWDKSGAFCWKIGLYASYIGVTEEKLAKSFKIVTSDIDDTKKIKATREGFYQAITYAENKDHNSLLFITVQRLKSWGFENYVVKHVNALQKLVTWIPRPLELTHNISMEIVSRCIGYAVFQRFQKQDLDSDIIQAALDKSLFDVYVRSDNAMVNAARQGCKFVMNLWQKQSPPATLKRGNIYANIALHVEQYRENGNQHITTPETITLAETLLNELDTGNCVRNKQTTICCAYAAIFAVIAGRNANQNGSHQKEIESHKSQSRTATFTTTKKTSNSADNGNCKRKRDAT